MIAGMPHVSTDAPRAPVRARKRSTPTKRLQAVLAGFAHEVRTPLNGILVLADLLATSDLPQRERDWASAMKSAAEHLSNLTTVVVDGAHEKTLILKEERFDPTALLETLAASLQARAAAKDLQVEVAIAPDLPRRAVGDPVRLRAAVENLLDNALKFTAHGRVRLAAEIRQDDRFTITVTDTGIGLSKVEIRRLFRPFAQANAEIAAQFGGAGLGLAFARAVARAAGGDLTVASTPGEGSAFRFETRLGGLAPATPADAHDPNGHVVAPPMRVLRVLCAEDNPYGRIVLRTIANAFGHTTDFVSSGDAAVAAVEAGGCDLVIMDVTLPGTDGIEATQRIRTLSGPAGLIPVIGLSGHADVGLQRRALAAGMNAYLIKPVDPGTLAAAIAAAIAG
jgi:CheY-like chemotaxis protein